MNNNKPLGNVHLEGSPFVVIVVTSFATIVISIYSLLSGWVTIFQNLFYIPIIIACVYYIKKGFVFSVGISFIYFFLIIVFTKDSAIIIQALIRVVIFIGVAGTVTSLSIKRKRLEDKLNQALKEEVKSCGKVTSMLAENNQVRERLEKSLEELKETQAQLVQAEKIEAIGRMALGVAHEVKNPLGIILQGINYFEGALPLEEKDNREMLRMMKDSVHRADNIVGALLDFSRAKELKMELQDINSIIESSIDLVQHRLKFNNIEVVYELGNDLIKTLIDAEKIEQVFINLFNNAVDAMPKGGKLYLRSYLSGEGALIVEVEDTGVGMDEEIMKKIFDPFFTTKNRTEGTGLGLSVAKNIIEMHKALINVESKKGIGTKFTIVLKRPQRGKG